MREKKVETEKDQLEKGDIEPASSKWARPVVFVPKIDGSLRFCVEYQKRIEATVADTYLFPRIDG